MTCYESIPVQRHSDRESRGQIREDTASTGKVTAKVTTLVTDFFPETMDAGEKEFIAFQISLEKILIKYKKEITEASK